MYFKTTAALLCAALPSRAEDDASHISLLQTAASVLHLPSDEGSGNATGGMCKCASPNQGTSGHNKYTCSGGASGYCASDQVCYATDPFPYGDWGAGCALPTCTCDTPNAGTAGHNQYHCNDKSTAYCSSDQVCYSTGSFLKGNWQLGCQITCTCNRAGTLHHVTECNQCNRNFCEESQWSVKGPNLENTYAFGVDVPDMDCGFPDDVEVAYDTSNGAIYVLEPTGQTLYHVDSCNECGRSWCQESNFYRNAPSVEWGYTWTGSQLSDLGCENVPQNPKIIRNSDDGMIYFVQEAPVGSYKCTNGQSASCSSGVQCAASKPFLITDTQVGCPAVVTTTTQAPSGGQCASWCNSKKHKSQPWVGGKCSWEDCAGCQPCPQ